MSGLLAWCIKGPDGELVCISLRDESDAWLSFKWGHHDSQTSLIKAGYRSVPVTVSENAAQKACEHCDSGIAAVVEERAREIAKAMPSGMLEMSNADYWTTQINAAITLAVQQERDRCMAECEQLRRDAERYLKLRHLLIDANGVLHTALNFKGFIEIGEREIDTAIDAASAEGDGKLAKMEKFASGDENRNIGKG